MEMHSSSGLTVYHDADKIYPKDLGFYFPAEWHSHRATWLSWPHKTESWPGKIDKIYKPYSEFIKTVAAGEKVCINVTDEAMKSFATAHLESHGVNMDQIIFYFHPTNDAWCRDHGPAFIVHKHKKEKAIIDWGYNAWGNKYPPYDLDDVIPTLVAEKLRLPVFYPGIVMEGGSVDFNGNGTLITSTACLLHPNRNSSLNQQQIENYLVNYYGVEQVLWVDEGIVGDDTDGHIDDTVRFVNEDTVVTVIEENKQDENYELLQTNLKQLKQMRLLSGKPLNIIEIPMPSEPVIWEGQRLPASYANIYIANHAVIVPVYHDKHDEKALQILQDCFPQKKVIGIDSTDIIWGLGSWHCLSQQEPELL